MSVIATADVEGKLPGDLSFKKGDKLRVVAKNGGDWWSAVLGDALGDIPRKSVRMPPPPRGAKGKKAPPPPPKPKAKKLTKKTRASVHDDFDGSSQASPPRTADALSAASANFAAVGTAFEKQVWHFQAFRDLFMDSYLCNNLEALTADKQKPVRPLEKRLYSETFRFFVRVMQDVASRVPDFAKQLGTVAESLLSGQSLMDSAPIGVASASQLHSACADIVNRVKALHGAFVIVPIGWTRPSNGPHPEGHIMFLTISKDGGHSGLGGSGTCTVALTNTAKDPGFGMQEYHGMHIDNSSKFKRNLSYVLREVESAKLEDGSFWFALLHGLCFPHKKNGPENIYESMLPYLNRRKLLANATDNDWRSLPRGQDRSKARALKDVIYFMLQERGMPRVEAKRVMLHVRWSLLRMAMGDIARLKVLSSSEGIMLNITRRQVAHAASKLAEDDEESKYGDEFLAIENDVVQSKVLIDERLKDEYFKQESIWAASNGELGTSGGAAFPLFDRVNSLFNVENLAGFAKRPPILRPVQLSLVPDRVESYHDVEVALRHCTKLCTLMSYQTELIRNTYCLRVSLIQHLFTKVIPVPLAEGHPDRQTKCFWAQPMRYETQADILRLLNMVTQHYTSSVFSLKLTRSFDAARILTMSCIAAVADAVARIVVTDTPSEFSTHLNGTAAGPCEPFGFEIGYFLKSSACFQFTAPEFATRRTQVLDYFVRQRKTLRTDHIIFRFEKSNRLGNGDLQFLNELCLHMGFPPEQKGKLLTGDNAVLLDNYPELGFYRDIVFLFKCMLVPTSNDLPDIKPWMPTDARLHWKIKVKKLSKKEKEEAEKKAREAQAEGDEIYEHEAPEPIYEYSVQGFNKNLRCQKFKDDGSVDTGENVFNKIAGFFGAGVRPRVMQSNADPSLLVGETIKSEEDVLHIEKLPDFDGELTPRYCELLIQYLTVPYLRIPLVIRFFADEARIKSLRHPKLQSIVDSCLFEPAEWQENDTRPIPSVVPELERQHLMTPVGLLFNELTFSPQTLLTSITSMLRQTVDFDTGKYVPHTGVVSLYVIRLAVRVEGYCRDLLHHNTPGLRGKWHPHVRGITGAAPEILAYIREWCELLRAYIRGKVFPIIERWCKRASSDRDEELSCALWAHMAFLYRNVRADELDFQSASVLILSQIFLNSRYNYGIDTSMDGASSKRKKRGAFKEEHGTMFGIPYTEIFDLFQSHRRKLLQWLEANPNDKNSVMESVVRVVTGTGKRRQGSAQGDPATPGFTSRGWNSMQRFGCVGRYVPDTESDGTTQKVEAKTYVEWLRKVTTQAVETEINVQVCRICMMYGFALQSAHLPPLRCAVFFIATVGGVDVEKAPCGIVAHEHYA